MRKTLGERLAYEGYAIEATDDVSEASEMCRQMAFDVVLTDDSSNASPLGIPFIVLAGAGDNQIQRAVTAFRDGAMDFLQILRHQPSLRHAAALLGRGGSDTDAAP